MTTLKKTTIEQIEKVLRAKGGNVSATARSLKVDRPNLYRRIKASARLMNVIQELREERTDLAEDQLGKAIKNGDLGAIIFHLKTIGKNRGYSEKTQTEHSGSVEATINVGEIARQVVRDLLDSNDDDNDPE